MYTYIYIYMNNNVYMNIYMCLGMCIFINMCRCIYFCYHIYNQTAQISLKGQGSADKIMFCFAFAPAGAI